MRLVSPEELPWEDNSGEQLLAMTACGGVSCRAQCCYLTPVRLASPHLKG